MEDESKDASPNETVDRIVLKGAENDRLQGWVNALNVRFDGMIRVTKSDLANFLIREHPAGLSDDEVQSIQSDLYDETRWLNWAVAKLRQSKKDGVPLSLNDLMVKRDAVTVKKDGPMKRTTRKRSKATSSEGGTSQAVSNHPVLRED